MSADSAAGPDTAGDAFAEDLVAQLDRYAGRSGPAAPAGAPTLVTDLVTELRAASTWAGPPAGLRESILTRVRAEAAGKGVTAERAVAPEPIAGPAATAPAPPAGRQPEPAPPAPARQPEAAPPAPARQPEAAPPAPARQPEAAPVPPVGDPPRGRPRPAARWRARWGRLTWAVPAAALAAAVFTAGVVAVDRSFRPEPPGDSYTAAGSALAPDATAKIRVRSTGSGFSVTVDFTGLPAAAPGSYYAAWLRGPQGVVPLGSFHERAAWKDVDMWSGVDPAGYSTFVVTLQSEGDPPAPSTLVVMTARLTR